MELGLSSDRQINSAFQYLRSSPEITGIYIRVIYPGKQLQRSIKSILLSDVQIAEFNYDSGDWTEEVNLL